MLNQRETRFEKIRIIGILCLFMAHINVVYETNTGYFISRFFLMSGLMTSPLFFMLAGYFSNNSKNNIKSKLKKLLIPLIIVGTLTYFINSFYFNTEISVIEYFQWLLGYNNWYYFVTVLIIFSTINSMFKLEKFRLLLVLLSIVSLLGSFLNIIPFVFLNPFNWIIFYVIGQLIKDYSNKIDEINIYLFNIIFTMYTLLLILFSFSSNISYIHINNPLFLFYSIIFFVALFMNIDKFKISYSSDINYFYFVYLIHIQPLQFLSHYISSDFILLFYPLLFLVILHIGINILTKIFLRFKMSKLLNLIGIYV